VTKIIGILGQRCCPHCNEPKDTIGTTDFKGLAMGGQVSASLALRDVVAEENEFFVLLCGHRMHKLQPTLFSQEWLIDMGAWDALPIDQKFTRGIDDIPRVTRDSVKPALRSQDPMVSR